MIEVPAHVRGPAHGHAPLDDWMAAIALPSCRLTSSHGPTAASDGRTVSMSGLVVGLDGPDARPPTTGAHTADDVLRAFARRGTALFPLLRGQFAIAFADSAAQRVYVVRDPLGAHPLFYAQLPDEVVLATRPQTLLAYPGVPATLNRAAIADHLCQRWPLRQETFFEAIRRVPPGWCVDVSRSGVSTSRYWNPVDPSKPIPFLRDDEIQRFDGLLDLATERAFTGRRAAIFLSGGFDSVSVAAVACEVARRRGCDVPTALSMTFPSRECDERHVQAAVAQRLELPLHMVDFEEAEGRDGLLRSGLDLNPALGAPLFNTWLPAYLMLLDRGIATGVDTILTGGGGDDWLGTSPLLAADLLARADLAGLLDLARTYKRSFNLNRTVVIRSLLWTYGLRPLAGRLGYRIAPRAWDARRVRKVLESTPPFISHDVHLRAQQHARAYQNLAAADPPGGFYAREAGTSLDHPLMSWLFEEQFSVGARRGVRYVHPYWDADLVAHMCRVSPEQLNEGNRSKALIRQTVDRRFPGLGFRRQRKVTAIGFFADLVRRQGPALAAQVSDFRGLASIDIVDPSATRAFLADAWRRPPRILRMAWNIVNMEYWVRNYV